MANYRQVHTKMWKDDWFLDLLPEHKLFFIYLFTNERASISGLYELSARVMAFESGLTQKEINEAFSIFERDGKAYYKNGVIWCVNLRKYHENSSPKVQGRILKDVQEVKECELKRKYCEFYGIHTIYENENRVSIPPFTSKSYSKSIFEEGGMGGETNDKPKCQDCDIAPPNDSGFCDYCQARRVYKRFFPGKRQPQAKNQSLREKFKQRWKVIDFREAYVLALERASQSTFINNWAGFDFAWFLKNDKNWRKCQDGNYDDSPKSYANGHHPPEKRPIKQANVPDPETGLF